MADNMGSEDKHDKQQACQEEKDAGSFQKKKYRKRTKRIEAQLKDQVFAEPASKAYHENCCWNLLFSTCMVWVSCVTRWSGGGGRGREGGKGREKEEVRLFLIQGGENSNFVGILEFFKFRSQSRSQGLRFSWSVPTIERLWGNWSFWAYWLRNQKWAKRNALIGQILVVIAMP